MRKGKFRPVSGFLNGLREGYKAVTKPGHAGQLSAYGTLAATASEELEAFKKFTKEKENREKAQIPEEAVRVALHLAASREHGLKKAWFSTDQVLRADTLTYLCSFRGGMEDPIANQQMLHKALAIKEQHFGEHHWQVGFTLDDLAVAHFRLGDHKTQKELLERALKIFQDWGEEHVVLASTLVNLGGANQMLGQYETAKDVLERALKIKEQHVGQEHFEVAISLTNLGNMYLDLKDYEKAKDILERALKIQEQHYDQGHFEVAKTVTNLGNVHMELEDYDILERSFDVFGKHNGHGSVEVAITLYNLAVTHGALGEHEKASEMLERVLLWYEDHFGAHHDRCTKVRQAIDSATRSK